MHVVMAGLLWAMLGVGSVHASPVPPPPEPEEGETDVEPEPEPEPEPESEADPESDAEPVSEPVSASESAAAAGAASETTAATATAPETDPQPPPEGDEKARPRIWQSKYLTLEGYVQPQYTFRVRRNARPRDQREFGADATRAGLVLHGHVLPRWSYRVHFTLGAQILNLVSDVNAVDYEGDGSVDGLYLRQQLVPGIGLEELWVNYEPVAYKPNKLEIISLDLRLGQILVPFSAQNQTQNYSLLFPRRSQPSQAFLARSDLGGQVQLGFADKRVLLVGGVFNGTGLAVQRDNTRGAMYAGRIEVAPLGVMPYTESDLERGPFRFALGSGLLYRPFRVFDDAGNDTLTRARDLLANASVRASVFGFFAAAEFMRRQITDNLSSRPFINTGAYGLFTFFFPVYRNFGMAPLASFGWTATDESFSPYHRYFTQDGIAIYLSNERRLDAVRVLLLYQGEWRVTEQESAQGGAIQVQVKF
jgi:hypothetical protein